MLNIPVKSLDLYLFISFVFLLILPTYKCQTVNLTFEADKYEAYIGSPSLTLTCRGTNMKSVDVVWLTYMTSNFNSEKAIYSDNKYLGNAANKYFINITQLPNDTIATSLTIFNVQQQDFNLAYRCECNIYKRCSNTNHARDSITIRALKPVFNANPSNFSKKRNSSSCIDGPYNTTQYFLYLMTFFILLACTFLLYFCDQRSPNEKFFLIFIILIATIFIVTSTIIWINSEFVQKSSFIALTIVCLFLMGCIILWTLNLNLAIRLNLIYEIRSLIYMLYLLEGFSSILSIISNVYCTGSSQLPALASFDYSYLELIGSGFLLIFSLFLLLTFGIIFYCITIQEKNNDDNQKITKYFQSSLMGISYYNNLIGPSVASSAGMHLSNVSLDKLSTSTTEKQPIGKSNSDKHNSPEPCVNSRNSSATEKKITSRINSVIGSISQMFSHNNNDKVSTISTGSKNDPEKTFMTKSGIHASSIFIEKPTSQHNDSNVLDYINRESSKTDLNSQNTDRLTQLGQQQMDLFEKKLNLEFSRSNTNFININNSNTIGGKPKKKKEGFFEASEFKRSINNMSKSSFGDTVYSCNQHNNSTPSTSDSEKSKKSTSALSIETVKTSSNRHNRIRINLFESAREKSKEEYNKLYKKLKNTREQFANNKLKNINLKY